MTDTFAVTPTVEMTSTPFHTACVELHAALAPGIRVVRASFAQVKAVYKAAFHVVVEATMDVDATPRCLAAYTDLVQFQVERDLYSMCAVSSTPASLAEWTVRLQRAAFVQDGHRSCMYPYNQAMVRFDRTHSHTDSLVRRWVHRMLRAHEMRLNECVHETFSRYLNERMTYVTCTPGCVHEVQLTSSRNVLKQWLNAFRPFEKGLSTANEGQCPSYVTLIPSLLPFVHEVFTGFTSLKQGLWFLSRCYEVEMEHFHLLNTKERKVYHFRYPHKLCIRRLLKRFDIDAEWHVMQTRLTSRTPREGPPSLFYDEALLQAFMDFDACTIEEYGVAFATVPFRQASRFDAPSCIHLFHLYVAASLRLHPRPLKAQTVRNVWTFVDTLFTGRGPGGCFGPSEWITSQQMDSMRTLERLYLSTVVLGLLLNRTVDIHPEATHPLLPWLMEMMDPESTSLDWQVDREWWLDLFAATKNRERLLHEYLEHSFKPRLVTRDYHNDHEMELMVCVSMRFKDIPSRALQQFRLLLAPCSISPTYGMDGSDTVASVYLAPQLVWRDAVPRNGLPSSRLHPIVEKPLVCTAEAYPKEFYAERRVTWSHWYSTATVRLESEGKPAYTLTAPVAAISVVAMVAETDAGLTQMAVHNACGATFETDTESRYPAFWLQYLVNWRVLTYEVSLDPAIYRVTTWSGERTLPIPDAPLWARQPAYTSTSVEASSDATSSLSADAQQALLSTSKELVEATCVKCLKHSHKPYKQRNLVAYVCSYVLPYVAVSTQEVSDTFDGLVQKGYIVRVDDDRLAYAEETEDEER